MRNEISKQLSETGKYLTDTFNAKSCDIAKSQLELLKLILSENQTSQFGKRHNFADIKSIEQFQASIPIQNYESLSAYINLVTKGVENALQTEKVIMFNLTSGTTDKPKYIPVTQSFEKKTANAMTQWLYRILREHPNFLNGKSFIIASSINESATSAGTPCGSMSGLIYHNLPTFMHESFALPFFLSKVQDYDLRYYLMARLGFESDVSFLATPNPMTLIKLAETGVKYQNEIIEAIEKGSPFTNELFKLKENDSAIVERLNKQLYANPQRAGFLRSKASEHTELLPKHYWKNLSVIGCWLGGAIGYHAHCLKEYYGNVPLRDLGYMASEGIITIPTEDNTAKGVLAIENSFYEFIPSESDSPTPLLSHQLKVGKRYKILLTNHSGLYRYDINDTIKVEGFYNQTPIISFVRKTENVLNIMGEKVHINHLIHAADETQKKLGNKWLQFRIISSLENRRYEIMLTTENSLSQHFIEHELIPAFDSFLSECNMEYQQKRKSHRLRIPCVHLMRPGWAEKVKKHDIKNGKRDVQYKWKIAANELSSEDQEFIIKTISREDSNDESK